MTIRRPEYKILIGLLCIFGTIIIILLTKGGYIQKWKQDYQKKQLVQCKEETFTNGIQYTNHICTVQDETGKSYTIEYPQIEEKNKDIKNINKSLKKSFDQVYKSIQYSEIDGKKQFSAYQKMNYQVYQARGMVSFLVENQDIVGSVLNTTNKYKVYNIDIQTYQVLNEEETKEKLEVDRNYSSTLKGIIVKMYMENFRYDYNNELEIYRNRNIDQSIENITYHAINNIYIDNDEKIHFILYLYNPKFGESIPYRFAIDELGNTTYEIIK